MNRLILIAISLVLIIAGLYIFIAFLLMIFQSKMIFYPDRDIIATPKEIGLVYEDIYFTTTDNIKLNGWFVQAEQSRGVIIFCHGNAGNISHRLESIKQFVDLGFSVFIFDYRGFGLSSGKITEQGSYLDAEAAYNYIIDNKNIDPIKIVFFGRSLGGSVASWLAKEKTPKLLIIESTFTSIVDFASQTYPIFPVKLLLRFDYNTKKYLQEIKCPVLIIHSVDDEMIPFNHAIELFNIANEPKELLKLTGTHNEGFMFSRNNYITGLKNFLNKYFPEN